MKKNVKKSISMLMASMLALSTMSQVAFAGTDTMADMSEIQVLEQELLDGSSLENEFETITSDVAIQDVDIAETLAVETKVEDLTVKSDSPMARSSATTYNTDPNSAIYLPESYFGYTLQDIADANDRWYVFESNGSNKISIDFQQTMYGNYDLVLYKLVGSTLYVADTSITDYTVENINYIADSGIYYLRVMPRVAPSVSSYFQFRINMYSGFDSYEYNDSMELAQTIKESTAIVGTIDNVNDVDWYKVTPTKSETMEIRFPNAPSGTQLGAFVYDKSANLLGSFLVEDDTRRQFEMTAGQEYYVEIMNYTQTSPTAEYSFEITPFVGEFLLSTGHFVNIDGDSLYIDGVKVDLDEVYMTYTYPSFLVREQITNFGNITFVNKYADDDGNAQAMTHTYYKDGPAYQTARVIPITITDGFYYAYNSRFSFTNASIGSSYYFDTVPNRYDVENNIVVEEIIVFVDLDTGKMVDTEISMHYYDKNPLGYVFYDGAIRFQSPTPII